nr:hypothetical protein [Tanacetum cinerariifolium]
MFTAGKTVEVAFDNEDPHEVWVPATVLKYCGDSTFLVEYQQPGNGNQVVQKATVDYWHIRPPPPHPRDKNFGLYEEVDVYYANGWWSGVITKELADNRYNVFFVHSKKERAFIRSKVRPHMKWYDGKWYNKGLNNPEGDADEDATRSLINKQIEQTPPTIAKQSTDATSIMKRTKQTIPESNDNNSSPSKKMKNGTFMDDSRKKTNGTSAGQSEDLDSEFGRTENLSYGTKVHSTREKVIEQETPTMDFSKKKGKAANENESVNLDEGANDDSGKTKTQESSEKDANKDLVLPVVTGLQCNEITISQEKIIEKCSNEIVPSVAEGDTKQLVAPSEQLTVVDKEVHEENASTVAPKRKRGRPPKLQAKSPETPLTDNHRNEGVDPSAVSVVESAQMKESSPTGSGAKSLEPLKQDKLHNESQEQDLKAKRSRKRKRFSFGRGKRSKRRTISINTEAPVQVFGVDSQDASEEKADENMETRKTDASGGKLLDTVSDDQPLSRWIDGMHSPVRIQNP